MSLADIESDYSKGYTLASFLDWLLSVRNDKANLFQSIELCLCVTWTKIFIVLLNLSSMNFRKVFWARLLVRGTLSPKNSMHSTL